MINHILKNGCVLLIGLILLNCSSSQPVNDFFGIEMPPDEMSSFRVNAYTELSGISYYSSPNMNPNLSAWAEIEPEFLRISISNKTAELIKLNQNADRFTMYNKDQNEFLLKVDPTAAYRYPNSISPNANVEIFLRLPQNFWQNIGTVDSPTGNEDFTEDFWKGENTIQIQKEKISYLKIELNNGKVIILKPVPEYRKN